MLFNSRVLSVGTFALAALSLAALNAAAASSAPYRPIEPSMSDKTIVLTGRDLTVDQVVQVARYGARVALTPEARQRSADAHALLLEAAAEGVSVYWFNRGSGSGRERFIFNGDPLSPDNKKLLEARQLSIFRRGALAGLGPEIAEEEIVRAMMVVRANTMTFEAASPQLTQRLLDLLNDRITPVVQSRGTVGEGDLGPFTNVGATMVGAGNAYYRGVRMPAAEALKQAGLEPLAPFGADDSELESSNSYATGQTALLLYETWTHRTMVDGEYLFDATVPLAISVVAWVAMVIAGSLGWTLVQTHHVGIKPALVRADRPSREPELEVREVEIIDDLAARRRARTSASQPLLQ